MELINHIRKLNAWARQQMAENPDVWVSELVEDPAHWKGYGITTIREFNLYLDDCYNKEVRKGNIVEAC